ncbi:MAG TPA: DUF4383 domain-containing protein [Chloroflexota bacterium]|nr:DUF4383 domain-containing protein [Chloroflexota bacterium]
MVTRSFVAVFGVIYLILGILGFIPALSTHVPANAPSLIATGGHGDLFGLFPVNYVSDVANIIIGLWGLLSFPRVSAAVAYAQIMALIMTITVTLGFFPYTNTLYGLVPLYANDAWLHAVSALSAAYFGWVALAPTREEAAHAG